MGVTLLRNKNPETPRKMSINKEIENARFPIANQQREE